MHLQRKINHSEKVQQTIDFCKFLFILLFKLMYQFNSSTNMKTITRQKLEKYNE